MDKDPLDVRRVLADMAELLCHEIITDSNNRIERSNQLNYFLDRLGVDLSSGRLYSFTKLASVMFNICAREAYPVFYSSQKGRGGLGGSRSEKSMVTVPGDEDEERREGEGEEIGPIHEYHADFTPLSEFTVQKWEWALSELKELRGVLLRRDATRDAVPKNIPNFSPVREEAGESGEAEEEDDDDVEVDDDLAASSLFAENYNDVINAFRFQQSFSFLRTALEEEVVRAEKDRRDTLHIEAKDLKAYEEFISEHFDEGNGIRECLESILVKGEIEKSRTRSAGLALKPAAEVQEIIRNKNFDLRRFQRKIEAILRKWYNAVLPEPVLAELGYGRVTLPPLPERDAAAEGAGGDEDIAAEDDNEIAVDSDQSPKRRRVGSGADRSEESEEVERNGLSPAKKRRGGSPGKTQTPSKVPEVEALKQSREQLLEGIEDPLSQCRAEAAEAGKNGHERKPASAAELEVDDSRQRQTGTPPMQRKGRTKHQINFSDSDESSDESDSDELSDDDSDEGHTATLSELPKRAKVRHPKKKSSTSGKAKSSHTRINNYPKGRKPFTEEENSAIKCGVEKFGFGRWAAIKDYYREELKARTSIQIKDRYRTMMKNNLV